MQIELKYTLSRALRLKMISTNVLVLKMNLINFFLSLLFHYFFFHYFSGFCWILLLLLLWIPVGALMAAFFVIALAIWVILALNGAVIDFRKCGFFRDL